MGKISNSQVAVFARLSNGDFASMVDARLYLPEDWCIDPARCNKAGIPDENRAFMTKLKFAADIIEQQVRNGVSFDFIGAEGYYGNDANLAMVIDQMGYINMLDIHSNQKIFINQPELFFPECKSNKCPAPQRFKSSTPDMSVSGYMENLQPCD